MTDQGAKWTDEETAALEQRIRETYEEAVSDMTEKFNRFARKFKRDEKEMKARLARGEISEADYRDWLAGQVFQGKRWRRQRDDLADTLTHASQIAADIINDATPGAFAYNANWAAFQIEKAGNANMGFELYDTQTVKRLLRDEPNLLPPSRVAIPEERRWNMQNITRQITQGVIQGEALDTIAKRLQRAATMDFNQARTHARTAMTGAQNAGRIETYHRAEDMGIKLRKEWLATLDSHTRHEHAILDGQKRPVDEPFEVHGKRIMYPGDPSAAPELTYNCRCTLVSDVADWPAENAKRRDNENRVNIKNMTFAEWAGWKQAQEEGSVEDIKGENISPKDILPVNEITDQDKFAALAYDFAHSGYSGRPIVAGKLDDGTYQALTGSHRIFAARAAGIDIPTVTLPYNDDTAVLFDAMNDRERIEIVERLYEAGKIEKDVYRLMTYEDEANFSVSKTYAAAAKAKAALWKAEQEAKAKAEEEAKKAVAAAAEKAQQEKAKERAESQEMAEYKAFYAEMEAKYGEHMWAEMNDEEYAKLERMERIAYKGE